MGLAWLSLFFSWNVNMVVEAHKVLKKRRQRHRHFYKEEPQSVQEKHKPDQKPTVIDIFNFPKDDDYSTVIKEIGATAHKIKPTDNINRSKSCNDILATHIQTLEHSPRHRRLISISEVFMNAKAVVQEGEQKEGCSLIQESNRESEPAECATMVNEENKDSCAFDSDGIIFTVPTKDAREEKSVQHPDGGDTRFTICKVVDDLLTTPKTKGKNVDKDDRQ